MWDWQVLVVFGVLLSTMLATLLVVAVYKSTGRDPSELRLTSGKCSLSILVAGAILYAIETGLIYVAQVYVHGRPFALLGFDGRIASGLGAGTFAGLVIFALPRLIAFGTAKQRRFGTALPQDETPRYVSGILAALLVGLVANSFVEELVFRVYPIEQLISGAMDPGLVILISSVLFAAMHHILEPFSLRAFMKRLTIGVIFGELYILSYSIWLLIGVHTGANLAALIFCGQWRIGGILLVEHDRPVLEAVLGWVLTAFIIIGLGVRIYL